MKKIVLIFSVLGILMACSATKNKPERRCKTFPENNFVTIVEDKFQSVVNKDTVFINEVKYECVHTAFYTQKIMYDKFGKWDTAIYPNDDTHPILVWEDVQLFPNNPTKFKVAARGLESRETTYASVIVYDEKNNDALADDSVHKQNLISYFGNSIRANNSEKKDFYEVYWTTVDKKTWEKLKAMREG